MKTTKRRFVQFNFYDRTGIQDYLEKQAQKGWLLEKITPLGWVFRNMEPKLLHFSVTYFPQASAFDPEPSENQKRFQDFCAHTGWVLAAANAQMQIFYNENENPIPIETDAAIEVETIHKAVKKSFLPAQLALLALGILQGSFFVWRLFSDPIGVLASNVNLFTGLCWTLVLLLTSVEITSYFLWHRKAKKNAEIDGSFVKTKSHRRFQLAVLCFMFATLGLMFASLGSSRMALTFLATILVMLVVIALVLSISALMQRLKVSAKVNFIITMIITFVFSFGVAGIAVILIFNGIRNLVPERAPAETYEYNGWTFEVYNDELPLTAEDIMDIEYHEYSCRWTAEESLFLAQFDAVQRPRMDALDMPELKYTITKVKLPILYDWCLQAMLSRYDDWFSEDIYGQIIHDTFEPIDAAPWGANAAYRLCSGDYFMNVYLLCFDDRIIEIHPDWELMAEQMNIIGQKLSGV